MANLVEKAKNQIDALLAESLKRAAEKGELPSGAALSGTVEVPKDTNNGDFAANHATVSYTHLTLPTIRLV